LTHVPGQDNGVSPRVAYTVTLSGDHRVPGARRVTACRVHSDHAGAAAHEPPAPSEGRTYRLKRARGPVRNSGRAVLLSGADPHDAG